jgi:hypothetical protein
MKEVLIKFETEAQASEFMTWLDNSGEQEYFEQVEYVDNEKDICDKFDYDYQNNIINGSTIKEKE